MWFKSTIPTTLVRQDDRYNQYYVKESVVKAQIMIGYLVVTVVDVVG